MKDYNLQNVEFKIPMYQEFGGESRRQMLLRSSKQQAQSSGQRQQQHQIQMMKHKLSECYQKLAKQIKLNNLNTQIIEQLKASLAESEHRELQMKQVLQNVIQNRKFAQKEREQAQHELAGLKQMIQMEVVRANQLEKAKCKLEIQNHHLKLEIETKTQAPTQLNILNKFSKAQNNEIYQLQTLNIRLQKDLAAKTVQLEALLRQRDQMTESTADQSVSSRTTRPDEQRKRFVVPPQPVLTENSSATNNSSRTQQTSGNQENCKNTMNTRPFPVGKWVKARDRSQNPPQKPAQQGEEKACIGVTADQQLSAYQIKKQQVEAEIGKLSNLRRCGPEERKRLDALEAEAYEIDSKIANLKRRIRHRY